MSYKYLFLLVLIPLFYFPCYVSNDMLIEATKEDGIYENFGALFFLLTAIIFFLLAKNPKRYLSEDSKGRKLKTIYFALLSLLFFFAFGEEISWGQRIFNYATPEAIKEVNAQGEFNLHNTRFFHGLTETGEHKKGIVALFTMHRLFYMAFVTYLFIIPLLSRLNKTFKAFIHKIGLPVPPIIFGVLFCSNWIYGNSLRASFSHLKGHGVVEIKEAIFALILLLMASYWLKFKNIKSEISE